MTLLQQCQIWHENGAYQKIIDAIEAVPQAEHTPELDSELARAYNNLAGVEDKDMYRKAISLLKPHEEYFKGDHCWNFRMGYAYYYLDREDLALPYFAQALEARPGDADTQALIDDCRRRLSLPRFARNFRQRTEEAWSAFLREEAGLRRLMDRHCDRDAGEELIKKCGEILNLALEDVSFELGYNGKKYELILTPEGSCAGLFPLVYFQRHAPVSVRERWDILVGRQPSRGFSLRWDGWEITADDVQVWSRKQGEREVSLTLYCEKLLPLLRENAERAEMMLSILTDQALGEINAIAYISGFSVTDTPETGPSVTLTNLAQVLKDMGMVLYQDAEAYLENSCLSYALEPVKDPDADWRLDVYTGSTRLPALINEYLDAESDVTDNYYRDGIAAGFLIYPLEGFAGEDRAGCVLDFRDALQAAVQESAGEDAVTFLGGATGLYCGYLDFAAWDLPAVLTAAADFFQHSSLPWAAFHSFRRDTGTVRLFSRDDTEPEVDPETGSLLSREDLNTLESFCEGSSGYFYKMLGYLEHFIEAGTAEGRFTEKQARRDLQIALWYAYGCLNIDEYEYYCRAAQWLSDAETKAEGCGMWYYRYSCALMYCGRLEEALQYAEQGAVEEADYPWIWLQLGKLRAHFGDKAGALSAVEQGLALVPDDYEFLTLREEILTGASLEQMEYHWIDPSCDRRLQEGLDEDADAKLRAISCITVHAEGLAQFVRIFQPDPASYVKDNPYCSFSRQIMGHPVDVVFRMNEAGISKLKPEWLMTQKERLDSGRWLTLSMPDDADGVLDTVLFGLDYRVSLIYKLPQQDTPYCQVWLDEAGTPTGPPTMLCADEDGSGARQPTPECYDPEEMEAVQRFIETSFGPVEHIFHELVSTDIHVDICLIPPGEERDCHTLVTIGMGAHRMRVPEELKEQHLERAELAIVLPPDWKLDQESLQDERWYWPVRLLKALARLPIACDTWLGWGHTMEHQGAFAESTDLCGAILVSPQQIQGSGEPCTLPSGEEVNFYQVIPLYADEMLFKQTYSAAELLERMEDVSFVVDPSRPHAVDETEVSCARPVMDDGDWHLQSIREKNLPVDDLTAFNHMAIYLRWCIEQDLMGLAFIERYWGELEEFQSDPEHTDLRPFLRDELCGQLSCDLFDDEGAAFARYYYGESDAPFFPSDIDDYALRYFGPARYHSNEFRQEAYLFIPFDEDYYQAMARVMQQRWDCWKNQEVAADTEPSELAKTMMRYLGCECRYFPSMRDDDPITAAFGYAQRLGVREGFVPLLVSVDETLWGRLLLNTDPDNAGAADSCFRDERVAAYRRAILDRPLADGMDILAGMLSQRGGMGDDGANGAGGAPHEMEGGVANNDFISYWDRNTERTIPLILAKIPVENPWEVFAYLPLGGWNSCPDAAELMAVAKYWFEQYGAAPAVVTHDALEFAVPAPVPGERAVELAREQYGFCPELKQRSGNIRALADTLRQSRKWYFWWG